MFFVQFVFWVYVSMTLGFKVSCTFRMSGDSVEVLEVDAESWSSEDLPQNEGDGNDKGAVAPQMKSPKPPGNRVRRCLIIGCRATFTGSSPMTRHILEGHCPQGISNPAKMAEFLRGIGRVLGILERPGETEERVLDRLRGTVQRGFGPVQYEFGVRVRTVADDLACYLGLSRISDADLTRFKRGLIVHTAMLAHPRVIAYALNLMTGDQRERLRGPRGGSEKREPVVSAQSGRVEQTTPGPVEDWDSLGRSEGREREARACS
jgi:hypothetical protein